MRESNFWLGVAAGCLLWVGLVAIREHAATAQDVRVSKIARAPEAKPLSACAAGDKVQLASDDIVVVVAPPAAREPVQAAPDGLTIPQSGSAPVGWPTLPTAPAGWVAVAFLQDGRLALLPDTWQAWPVRTVNVQVWE
jgi:hypothetical protein